MKQEPALEWLDRVSAQSNDRNARLMAEYAIAQWTGLAASWKLRKVSTRRSLWDLLAGVFECHQVIQHHTSMTRIESGSDVFFFPIFFEACGRRAKSARGIGAIKAGVPVKSERLPQTSKWGNIVCKT